MVGDGAGDDLLLRREFLEAGLVEWGDAIQQALQVAEDTGGEVLGIEEKQREGGARIATRELTQHGEAGRMLEDALAHVVALGGLGQVHEQGSHLGLIERTEVVNLELIVKGRAVVLALRRRAGAGSDEDGAAGPHKQLAQAVLLAVVQALEDELEIVHQQHRPLPAGLGDVDKRFVDLVGKGLIVLGGPHSGGGQASDGGIDLIDALRVLGELARIGQRVEAVQPEFGEAVHGVLLFSKYERDEAGREFGIRA